MLQQHIVGGWKDLSELQDCKEAVLVDEWCLVIVESNSSRVGSR